ncbi:amino acid permease [Phocicoccus pinnipedialis]|uniref:Lysine-specific permease n=1 Tax=Phocicoccus pinnipedialis TaxID=110845 RepID=A0A6V7R5V9_9BACL|nr:amino acid permease [Jeotgalicoccus pinnipedialis]MBP1939777.1 amino acid permease [Jeotgalicoccus pinnipedialis]CAD2072405.1 Lysine-specific permease [Jeotgalicoccus pinnipedialis]
MENNKMERGLKSRHVSMIAIGGAIGTGLFVATGGVIAEAGPFGALLAYGIIGIMLYFLMNTIGELATFYPVSGAFSAFSTRFVDSSVGFTIGWVYFLIGILVSAVDIIVASNVITFWEPMQFFSPFTWSLLFFSLIFVLNIIKVRAFGEAEYWLSLIKVITIIVFIVIGTLMIFGILGDEFYGFKNYTVGEAPFVGGISGFLGVLLVAGFSVGGTEVVAVTAGESDDPEKSMPKAVNQVFWRILIFYIGAIAVISAIIPYTDPTLLNETGSVNQSPFTIVFDRVGIAFAASVINTVILTSLLSASNSMLYSASRTLFALARKGHAPTSISKINNKTYSPLAAILVTCGTIFLIVVLSQFLENAIFILLEFVGSLIILVWLSNVWAQMRLRKAIKLQGLDIDEVLPFKAKGFPVGQYVVIAIILFLLTGGSIQYIIDFNGAELLRHYLPFIILIGIFIVHKLINKTVMVDLKTVDLSRKMMD